MTDALAERLINVALDVSRNITPSAFWGDWSFWLAFVSFLGLVITLIFLIISSSITKKMLQYQITPAIDVNMIYDKNVNGGKTYFWFKNLSNLPGFVYLEYKKDNEKRKKVYPELRISPKEVGKKTATAFDFLQEKGNKLTLYISIRPAIEKTKIKFEFEKSYIFTGDCWNEESWSFPDLPFYKIN